MICRARASGTSGRCFAASAASAGDIAKYIYIYLVEALLGHRGSPLAAAFQFYQAGVELLNVPGSLGELEALAMGVEYLRRCSVLDSVEVRGRFVASCCLQFFGDLWTMAFVCNLQLHINSIGSVQSRKNYVAALRRYFTRE